MGEFNWPVVGHRCVPGTVSAQGITEGHALIRSVFGLTAELDKQLVGWCAAVGTGARTRIATPRTDAATDQKAR